MGQKIALNVIYNVGIIVCLFIGYEGIMSKHYSWVLGVAFILVIFVILKIRLMKEVRNMNRRN
ncbi:hypothetical protein EOD41_06760 [Mucilaginibacter limnophilus]|uniref:Uncharacterized protein n=1 Tax=Mucilaginibacter limnophilus TaxID=1932778 RepID=A0A437MVG4_9SPHI|nr:DUF6358 family protein [Mucilaginibacter limnophilus]RVU01655.1 hypothetical protein EOD41_06760 [Mucilaginibacter limnophilus]